MGTPFKAAGLAGLVLLMIGLPACGGVYYMAAVNGAASKLEEARVLGADTLAPYEYYYAKEHLEQAQVEASEGSYGDAADFAESADDFAQKAINLAQSAHKAAGRE